MSTQIGPFFFVCFASKCLLGFNISFHFGLHWTFPNLIICNNCTRVFVSQKVRFKQNRCSHLFIYLWPGCDSTAHHSFFFFFSQIPIVYWIFFLNLFFEASMNHSTNHEQQQKKKNTKFLTCGRQNRRKNTKNWYTKIQLSLLACTHNTLCLAFNSSFVYIHCISSRMIIL